jgi:trehalose 6-phosphate synthase
VLVLSRFAGAAEELPEAVIVNPYVPADTARGLEQALAMPLAERRRRHEALLESVHRGTADEWARGFLAELRRGQRPRSEATSNPRREGVRFGA